MKNEVPLQAETIHQKAVTLHNLLTVMANFGSKNYKSDIVKSVGC
jgi:hypothetical protein